MLLLYKVYIFDFFLCFPVKDYAVLAIVICYIIFVTARAGILLAFFPCTFEECRFNSYNLFYFMTTVWYNTPQSIHLPKVPTYDVCYVDYVVMEPCRILPDSIR